MSECSYDVWRCFKEPNTYFFVYISFASRKHGNISFFIQFSKEHNFHIYIYIKLEENSTDIECVAGFLSPHRPSKHNCGIIIEVFRGGRWQHFRWQQSRLIETLPFSVVFRTECGPIYSPKKVANLNCIPCSTGHCLLPIFTIVHKKKCEL